MSAALVLVTAGRRTYLERTWESFTDQCAHRFDHLICVDDSGDADFGLWLDGWLGDRWQIIHHGENRGLPAAIGSAWDAVVATGAEWVFHLEEDWTFPALVDVPALIGRCDAADLDQLVLYRQPWSPQEQIGGGYLHTAEGYERVEDDLWVTDRLFSFNPCVYPAAVCDKAGGYESEVTKQFDGRGRFGVLTGADEAPMCWHIGVERAL